MSKAEDKKAEFDKLVDFVNTYYVKSYVDKKIKDNNSGFYETYIKDYKERINPKWEHAIINKNPLNSNELLKDLGGHQKATQLCEIINDKKKSLNEDWSTEEVIEYLIDLPKDKPNTSNQGYFGYLKNETDDLRKKLENQIPENLFNSEENGNKQTSQTTETEINQGINTNTNEANKNSIAIDPQQNQNSPSTNTDNRQSGNRSSLNIPFGWIFLSVLCVVSVYFGYKKKDSIRNRLGLFKSKEKQKSDDITVIMKEEIKSLRQEINQLKQNNIIILKERNDLESQIKELNQKSPQGQNSTLPTNEQPKQSVFPIEKEEKQTSIKITQLYADAIINGEFHRIKEHPNEDTVFELKLMPSTQAAMFCIYRDAYNRVIKNPDFVTGCIRQRINTNPQSLEIEKGEALVDDFGKWKITKKAIVKFI
jgi:hypothetical protein